VTNHHITKDATELSVAFSVEAENEDDLIVPAVLKGESNKADLAVLAVKLSDIKPEVYEQLKIATLGSSDKLEVGEAAIVIGNALGYGLSASAGIVSALDRDVVTELGTFKEFMVDAPINLGCSGGAILNSKGEVVGIVNCKDVNDYAESMGYGVPIDTAIPILQNLINRETRDVVENHGFLGVTVVPVSEEARTMYDMPAGAYVYEVSEGSAAEKAGIEKGNIITTFDGIEVEGSDDLVSLVSRYEVGETVNVTLQVPDGSSYVEKVVEVTLQEGVQTDDTNDQPSIPQEQEEKDDYQNSPENYNYGMGEDQYGDLFEWLFGNNSREDQDGWGSFFYGRN
jgi:serine protease Do